MSVPLAPHVLATPSGTRRRGAQIRYVSPTVRVRVFVKVQGMSVEQVPDGLMERLATQASISSMYLASVCVRAGCVELVVDLVGWRAQAPGSSAGAAAAGVLMALGLQQPSNTIVTVHWGSEQVQVVATGGGWAPVATVGSRASPSAARMVGPSAFATRHEDSVVSTSAGSVVSGTGLLGVSPLLLTTASGHVSPTPVTLMCSLSKPLLRGESLVVYQYGRCLTHQLKEIGDDHHVGAGMCTDASGRAGACCGDCRGACHVQLLVYGCDLRQPGLVRVELRGADGHMASSMGVLVVPSDAVALEAGQLATELEALVGATSADDATKREVRAWPLV